MSALILASVLPLKMTSGFGRSSARRILQLNSTFIECNSVQGLVLFLTFRSYSQRLEQELRVVCNFPDMLSYGVTKTVLPI